MFDQTHGPRKRIAIVGAGIAGMSAAYYLAPHHDVTLFEGGSRLGGHARTVVAGRHGDQPVDTGFIVFNYATYPHLTRLFRDLDVPVMKSHMSFGASIDDGAIEYGLSSIGSIAAQKRNLLRPQYYGMVADILRFGKGAVQSAEDDETTIGELVDRLKMGRWFREHYLLPMCGAIWSTPLRDVQNFPARSLVRFFRNHALLAGSDQHQWWTVRGGSIEYVRRLQDALIARGCEIRLAAPVQHVARGALGVTVRALGQDCAFDEVVMACHSDQALALLGQGATAQEAQALGAIRYQPNRAVLHRDPGQMPRRRAAWASWVYRSQKGRIGVSYWMNRLQGIPDSDPLFVTLNPPSPINPALVYDEVEFTHPLFDKAALKAQHSIRQMQGRNRTWFAGAYNRHGFHEDGIASAMRVVRMINHKQSWSTLENAADDQGPENGLSFDLRATA